VSKELDEGAGPAVAYFGNDCCYYNGLTPWRQFATIFDFMYLANSNTISIVPVVHLYFTRVGDVKLPKPHAEAAVFFQLDSVLDVTEAIVRTHPPP
ncbi:MAG: hypothetical protein ALECFALPRED_009281, partial [Alectoria fallacina]